MEAAAAPSVVVIGITGATRCGKGRVSKVLSEALGNAAVVGQDAFWVRDWRDAATGQVSQDEPECTDHAAFARAIEVAATMGARFVIAEGFQLLHDASVRALLGPIHLLELSRAECIRRRSAPRDGLRNPIPIDTRKMEGMVWPAHERYCAASVDPLGARVERHAAPSTDAEVAATVARIVASVSGLPTAPALSVAASAAAQAAPAPVDSGVVRTMVAEMAALPPHATVAVVTMRGSLCPITLGHVRCFEEARKLFLGGGGCGALPAGLAPFAYVAGFVGLNADHHLRAKFASKREKPLNLSDRQALVRAATTESAWLELSACSRTAGDVTRLRQQFPHLSIQHFEMNGADDVVKYSKWKWAGAGNKMITMGRPGSTPAVIQGMASVGIPAGGSADFVLGPELPDISSTKLRAASKRGDRAELLTLCHPKVADWMLVRDGHAIAEGIPTRLPATAGGARMIVGRTDGGRTTSLRNTATTSRDHKYMTGALVRNGDEVTLLRPEDAAAAIGFCWIRTAKGEEGFLNSLYLSIVIGGAGTSSGGGGGGGGSESVSLMAIVRRTDGGDGTLLRKVATTSRSGDVWTSPMVQVRSGEEVEVLRQEPTTGFAWVRTTAGVEGYLNAAYFLGHTQDAFVGRNDGGSSTLLRKNATTSRDASNYLDSRAGVTNGDKVEVLRFQREFCWVMTGGGEEGYLNTSYLSAAEVRRSDGDGRTLLRKAPTTSRDASVFVLPRCSVADGDRVQAVREEEGFVWVRTAAGMEGYLNRKYVWPMVWEDTGVLWMMVSQK